PATANVGWPPKKTKKWSMGHRTALLQLAAQHQIWPMKHKNDKQKERKQAFEQACRTGVYKEIFENKPDNTIKSMYENLLKRKRAHNKAAISGGTGTSPPPLDAESAALDKAAATLVDAIASSASQVKKEKDECEAAEELRQERIHKSRDDGMRNCMPGAGATAFPKPNFLPGRGGGTRPAGGGGSTGGRADGAHGSAAGGG
ncbi:unnamed protein product, partial [Pylaiella littoralis]